MHFLNRFILVECTHPGALDAHTNTHTQQVVHICENDGAIVSVQCVRCRSLHVFFSNAFSHHRSSRGDWGKMVRKIEKQNGGTKMRKTEIIFQFVLNVMHLTLELLCALNSIRRVQFSRVEIRALDDSVIQDHFGAATHWHRTQTNVGHYRMASGSRSRWKKYERRPSSLCDNREPLETRT